MKTEDNTADGVGDKTSDEWPKVLYRTETVEVWPHFTNSNYYHVRFKDTGVFYAEKAYLERQFQWNGNLDFSHALRAMKDGKRVRQKSCPKIVYFWDKTKNDYIQFCHKEGFNHDLDEFSVWSMLSDDWEIVS